MDIVGKESLENILKEYKGTLIFVSHDRYFVNKIADSLLIFDKDRVTYFNGNYEEYRRKKKEQEEMLDGNTNLEKSAITNANDKKAYTPQENEISASNKKENSYFINKEKNKMKNKINKLEKEIEEKEKQVEGLQKEMLEDEISTDYEKLKELQDKIQELNNEIESNMSEWEELTDILDN